MRVRVANVACVYTSASLRCCEEALSYPSPRLCSCQNKVVGYVLASTFPMRNSSCWHRVAFSAATEADPRLRFSPGCLSPSPAGEAQGGAAERAAFTPPPPRKHTKSTHKKHTKSTHKKRAHFRLREKRL